MRSPPGGAALAHAPLYEKRPLDRKLSKGRAFFCFYGINRPAGKGRIRVEAEQLEETLYSVNVMVELLGEDGETVVGLESWSFPYAFVNDRWVFTDFRLVY